MSGEGPFLWFREGAPDSAFRSVPEAGFCVSVFVFLTRGDEVLVGKYAEDPAWTELAGLDPARVRAYRGGWTVPGRHLRLGEHPRHAAISIVEEVLGLDPARVELSEPRVETSCGPHPKFPELGDHFDLWFLVDGELPGDVGVPEPPWYEELAFVDPRELSIEDWSRCHDEVADAFLALPAGRR